MACSDAIHHPKCVVYPMCCIHDSLVTIHTKVVTQTTVPNMKRMSFPFNRCNNLIYGILPRARLLLNILICTFSWHSTFELLFASLMGDGSSHCRQTIDWFHGVHDKHSISFVRIEQSLFSVDVLPYSCTKMTDWLSVGKNKFP